MPFVLTFMLAMMPFVSKDCRAVAVPRRRVPLALERKVNCSVPAGAPTSWYFWTAPSNEKVAPAATSGMMSPT